MTKINVISRKKLKYLEKLMIVCMFVVLLFWIIYGFSFASLFLAVLISLTWFVIHSIMNSFYEEEMVNIEKELSYILSRLGGTKIKLENNSISAGKVSYPLAFMKKPLVNYILKKGERK